MQADSDKNQLLLAYHDLLPMRRGSNSFGRLAVSNNVLPDLPRAGTIVPSMLALSPRKALEPCSVLDAISPDVD